MRCHKCDGKIGRTHTRVAMMSARHDLSGKKQWRTKHSKAFCTRCWGKIWARVLGTKTGRAQMSIIKNGVC